MTDQNPSCCTNRNGMESSHEKSHGPKIDISYLKDRISKWIKLLREPCIISWPGWLNFVLWTLGFLLMVGLTYKDLAQVIDDYNNNNIDYKMEIQMDPWPPDFTICLPYYSNSLFRNIEQIRRGVKYNQNGTVSIDYSECNRCKAMEKGGWNFWVDMNSTQLQSNKTVLEYVVKRFYKDKLYKQKLTSENYKWLEFSVDAVWYYFYCLYLADLHALTAAEFSNTGMADRYDWITFEAINWFPRQAVDQLYESMLNYLEQSIPESNCYPKNQTNPSMHPFRIMDQVTIMGDKFCFLAKSDNESVQIEGQDFECSYLRYNKDPPMPWVRYPTSNFEIYPSQAIMYSNVKTKDAIYYTGVDSLVDKKDWRSGIEPREHVYINYRVTSKMLVPSTADKPDCSADNQTERCIARGLLEAAIRECHCVPFTYRYLQTDPNSSLPYCNETQYKSCAQKIRKNSTLEDFCGYRCDFSSYDFDQQVSVLYINSTEKVPQFLVQFNARKVPYIYFYTDLKTNVGQFVSGIGGVVNLYLGVSGLTLIAMLIMCLDQSRTWHKHRIQRTMKRKEKKKKSTFDAWMYFRALGIFRSIARKADEEERQENDQRQNIELARDVTAIKEKIARIDDVVSQLCSLMNQKELIEKLKPKLVKTDETGV